MVDQSVAWAFANVPHKIINHILNCLLSDKSSKITRMTCIYCISENVLDVHVRANYSPFHVTYFYSMFIKKGLVLTNCTPDVGKFTAKFFDHEIDLNFSLDKYNDQGMLTFKREIATKYHDRSNYMHIDSVDLNLDDWKEHMKESFLFFATYLRFCCQFPKEMICMIGIFCLNEPRPEDYRFWKVQYMTPASMPRKKRKINSE